MCSLGHHVSTSLGHHVSTSLGHHLSNSLGHHVSSSLGVALHMDLPSEGPNEFKAFGHTKTTPAVFSF